MRAQTKRQRRVEALLPTLREITPRQVEWAKRKLFSHYIYSSGGWEWCSECGEQWPAVSQVEGISCTCPKCGTAMTVKRSRKQHHKEQFYFTTLDVCEEWQVVRHYLASRAEWKGHKAGYSIHEAVQIWIDEAGNEVVMARPREGLSGFIDYWKFNQPISVKYRPPYSDPYHIHAPIAPGGRVLSRLRRNGYTRHCNVLAPDELMRLILRDNRAETLVKQGQYEILGELSHKLSAYAEFAPAINIATRNGFKPKDASLWLDYIELLIYFKLDIRNAHYVCARDYRKRHDELSAKKHRIEAAARRKAEAARMREEQARYAERIGDYLSVVLSLGNLSARVLRNVSEFEEEGAVMRHCVFSNRYYARPGILIFTVRGGDDGRVATVEVDIAKGRVLQCRGRANTKPARYNDIMRMFEAGMPKIINCKQNI